MEMVRCQSCGFDRNTAKAKFCIHCGADLRLSQEDMTSNSEPPTRTPEPPTVVVKPVQKPFAAAEPPTTIVKPAQKTPAVSEPPTSVVKPRQKPSTAEPPTTIVKPAQKTPAVSESPTAVVKPGQKPSTAEPPTTVAKSAQKTPVVAEPPTKALIRAKLVIKQDKRKGHEFPITDKPVLLGRWDTDSGSFPEIDLTEDDLESRVSRKHARIFFEGNKYFVEDLGSLNGTFINKGSRLSPGSSHELHDGDEIIIGKTFLDFLIE